MANTKITADNLAANAVNASSIADGVITPAKIASGDFYFDTDTLYIDSTNNRVGIGTSSPAAQVHINNGTASTPRGSGFTRFLIDNDNATYLEIQTGSSNTGDILFSDGSTGDYGVIGYDHASDAMRILTASTERMRIDSSGNVGIGTTGAIDPLHVKEADGSHLLALETLYSNGDRTGRGQISWRDSGNITGGIWTEYDGSQVSMRFGNLYNSGYNTNTSMIIRGNGNVGIGRTSPSATLDVNGSMKVDNIQLQDSSVLGIGTVAAAGSIGHTASTNEGIFWHSSTAGYGLFRTAGSWTGADYQQLKMLWDTGIVLDGGAYYGKSGVIFENNGTEAMRLSSDGDFRVGTSGTVFSSGERMSIYNDSGQGLGIRTASTTGTQPLGLWNSASGTVTLVLFAHGGAGTGVGSITSNGSSTSYNTTSDHRLKENVVEMDDAINRVKLLQPKKFNFIATPEDTVDGFLAHEVQDIVPEAIHGTKDEVDEEGNPVYQGIDQSKLVPLLTKAIQEQQTIIDDLKARIETLENA